MVRQAIEQAEHGCDDESSEFTVTDTDNPNIDDDDAVDAIEYSVRCTCGDTGTITIDEQGTHASDGITYENASWNSDSDESEEGG